MAHFVSYANIKYVDKNQIDIVKVKIKNSKIEFQMKSQGGVRN